MPLIASFIVGFLLAQATWWFAAQGAGGADAQALGGAPTFRYLMVAGVEVLIAAAVFGLALALVSRARPVAPTPKSVFVAFAAGATTATIAAAPYALIPPIVAGEAMLLVHIVVAALVSAAFGALLAAAFRDSKPPAAMVFSDKD